MIELLKRLLALFSRPGTDKGPPSPTDRNSTTPPWMTWALKEVGFHERGQNLGIEKYITLARCGSPGDPWCAIFANAGLEFCGIRGTRSAMARSFEKSEHFVQLDGPAYGAITTMWRQSKNSGLGHVFYYCGENENGIIALGGNQSDQVRRQYEPRNRVVGYWWPAALPLPKTGKLVIIPPDGVNDEGSET